MYSVTHSSPKVRARSLTIIGGETVVAIRIDAFKVYWLRPGAVAYMQTWAKANSIAVTPKAKVQAARIARRTRWMPQVKLQDAIMWVRCIACKLSGNPYRWRLSYAPGASKLLQLPYPVIEMGPAKRRQSPSL
jgi:hypothetical protein